MAMRRSLRKLQSHGRLDGSPANRTSGNCLICLIYLFPPFAAFEAAISVTTWDEKCVLGLTFAKSAHIFSTFIRVLVLILKKFTNYQCTLKGKFK